MRQREEERRAGRSPSIRPLHHSRPSRRGYVRAQTLLHDARSIPVRASWLTLGMKSRFSLSIPCYVFPSGRTLYKPPPLKLAPRQPHIMPAAISHCCLLYIAYLSSRMHPLPAGESQCLPFSLASNPPVPPSLRRRDAEDRSATSGEPSYPAIFRQPHMKERVK